MSQLALPVVGIFALLVIFWGVIDPLGLLLVTLTACFFDQTLAHLSGFGIASVDDGLVILLIISVALHVVSRKRRLIWLPGLPFLAIFALLGLTGDMMNHVSPSISAQAMLGDLKGPLVGLAAAQILWDKDKVRTLTSWATTIGVVAIACGVVNLAAPHAWNTLFAVSGPSFRLGIPVLVGPFGYPAAFGRFLALVAIASAAHRLVYGRRRMTSFLIAGGAFGAALSLRRKTVAGLVAAIAWVLLRAKAAKTVVWVVVLAPLGLVALWSPLSEAASTTYNAYIVNPAARTRLTVDSVHLAIDKFPVGAGFGRFGSSMARTHYSPEYVRLGYENIFGLGDTSQTGAYLTDTQWPAFIGESGFIGAAMFALALISLWRAFNKATRSDDKLLRFVGYSGLGWTVEFLVESVASPVFTSAPAYPLLFGLGGLCAALTQKNRRETHIHAFENLS